jgi:hypothetical protein
MELSFEIEWEKIYRVSSTRLFLLLFSSNRFYLKIY